MPLNPAAHRIIFPSFPLKRTFKYLGITHHFKDLYKANFPPLLTSLKQDFERWDLLPLSLGGIIEGAICNT